MQLVVNDIFSDVAFGISYRVLKIDVSTDILIIIQMDKGCKLPREVSYSNAMEKLAHGVYTMCENQMPAYSFEMLTSRQKERLAYIWGILSDFVLNPEQCFHKKIRSKFIDKVVLEQGVSRKTVQTWLHQYWAGGSTQMALVPKYKERGGAGMERKDGKKKIGRPRKYITQNKTLRIGGEELKRIRHIMQSIYNKDEKYSFKDAYEQLLQAYYTNPETGKLEDAYPTKSQFIYHGKKYLNLARSIRLMRRWQIFILYQEQIGIGLSAGRSFTL